MELQPTKYLNELPLRSEVGFLITDTTFDVMCHGEMDPGGDFEYVSKIVRYEPQELLFGRKYQMARTWDVRDDFDESSYDPDIHDRQMNLADLLPEKGPIVYSRPEAYRDFFDITLRILDKTLE